MKLTFKQILTHLFNSYGLSYDLSDADTTSIKNIVNFVQDDICDRLQFSWKKEEKLFETFPAYDTGTVTIESYEILGTGNGTSGATSGDFDLFHPKLSAITDVYSITVGGTAYTPRITNTGTGNEVEVVLATGALKFYSSGVATNITGEVLASYLGATPTKSVVTGTDTYWTTDMARRLLIIDDEKLAYRIESVSSTTSLVLENVYINSTTSDRLTTASDYNIVQDRYVLENDFITMVYDSIKDIENEYDIELMKDTIFDNDYTSPYEIGDSTKAILRGFTQESVYSTGTITIATSSGISTVTGTSTAWIPDYAGRIFRVKDENR